MSADTAFVSFLAAFASSPVELVLFGRLDPEPGRFPHALPEGTSFVPLPHYPNARDLFAVARSARGSLAAFRRELPRLDAVWLFGPHPLSIAFASAARRARVPTYLGVRQEVVPYARRRLGAWIVPLAYALELAFRRLARNCPTVVVGHELERRYRRGPASVLATTVSLVHAADVVSVDEALARSWDGPLRLLSVGRIEPEKNPLLLADVLAAVRTREPRWQLTVVGDGPLRDALATRLAELGLEHAAELTGYVPFGARLWDAYRSSHAFLHVSLTEGVPQVLVEAHAAGVPVVATAVGGVPAALGDGTSGLLVPPADADAAASALERLRLDPELRARLVAAGVAAARGETIEARVAEICAFLGLR